MQRFRDRRLEKQEPNNGNRQTFMRINRQVNRQKDRRIAGEKVKRQKDEEKHGG